MSSRRLGAFALGLLVWAGPALAQKIEPAPEYESLFHRQSGWTGADGTYSYPQPDGRTVWGFSDTFFGEVRDRARQMPCQFVHNSLVIQEGANLFFPPAPAFCPPDKRNWFWLHDGADGDAILLGEIRGNGQDNTFGFDQVGLWAGRYQVSANRVRVLELRRLPFQSWKDGLHIAFGPAILQTSSWLYIYGVLDRDGVRNSVLARTPRGCLAQAGAWRFFDGQGWQRDMSCVKPLFAGAAMEASVHLTASGGYLYLGTDAGGMGDRIIARLAPRPEGPWGDPVLVYQTPEHQGSVFTYNAKAHPELSRDGRLLISYNVNTYDFDELFADAGIYRPRFLWWTPPEPSWLPPAESPR